MTSARVIRSLAGLFALACFATSTVLAQSAVPSRITQKIDETRLTTLVGHIYPAANAKNDRGPVDGSEHVSHILLLLSRTTEQQQELDALVEQLHNPKSENFHKWLTPAEFGERFEPADEDVAAVADWLKSKGLTVEEIPPSKTHITFTGTVGELQAAFHIQIHHLSVNGEAHESTMNEPQIPSALAPVIGGLHKLNDFQPKPQYKRVGTFTSDPKTGKVFPVKGTVAAPSVKEFDDSEGDYQVGPQDFYTIYNENPLLTGGDTGAGVTIAVIEEVQIDPADVTSFREQFALPAYPTTPNATGGGINYIYGTASGVGGDAACTAPLTTTTGGPNGTTEEGEADIDVQWAGTVAPKAIIDFVACGPDLTTNFGSSGVDHAAQHIVNYLSSTVTAASLSYGWCESLLGTSTTTGTGYYNKQWEQFAAEGITAIVSSGDSGTTACDNGDEYVMVNPSVNGMGSSAYNVSAGGTDLGDAYISEGYTTSPATTWWSATNGTGYGSALSYIPEITWGAYCSNSLFSSYLDAIGRGATYGTTPEALCNNAVLQQEGFLSAGGGSGGVSTVSAAPTWQNVYGVGLYSGSTTKRTLPDISLFAAAGFWGHLLPYCESDVEACTSDPNTDQAAGGTSFVAPQIAGLMALVNQKIGARQGQADYVLYDLAAQEYGTPGSPNSANLTSCSGSGKGAKVGSTCIFHDIAADTPSLQGGTIASEIVQPCVSGSTGITDCYLSTSTDSFGLSTIPGAASHTLAYYAGAGYDVTTGLGSVNISNLVNAWASAIGAVTLTPPSLTFPSTAVGVPSTPMVVTVKNSGSGELSIYSMDITGTDPGSYSFSPATTCPSAPSILSAGSSCTVSITFTPATTGTLTAQLNVNDNASGAPQTAGLTGTGSSTSAPVVSLTPTSLTFLITRLGSTSAVKVVTLKNTGNATLDINTGGITIGGADASSFAIKTTTCGATLAASASCTISVTFSPAAIGALTASLKIADNASGSPQSVPLNGTGTEVSLSPNPLAFGTVTGSKTLAVTVKNLGTTALTLTSTSITGSGEAEFSVLPYSASPATSTCRNPALTSLAQNATCTYSVEFDNADAIESAAANLNIFDNGGGGSQVESLTGTGTEVSLSPNPLAFGTVTASKTLPVTVKNVGTTALTFSSSPTITGTGAAKFSVLPYSASPATSTCLNPALTPLAQNATCTYSVEFDNADAIESVAATLNIFDNGGGSPQKEALSGTGTEVSLSPATLAFGTVTASKTLVLTVENVGTTALTFSSSPTITGTGAAKFSVLPYSASPATSTCLSPALTSLALDASCTYSVEFDNADAIGSAAATLNIFNNGGGSPQKEALSGTGTEVSLSPATLAFGTVATTSTLAVTVENLGTTALTFSKAPTVTGTGVANFVVVPYSAPSTSTCLNPALTSLAQNASCTYSVKFTNAGGTTSFTTTLNIFDNGGGSPQLKTMTATD